MGRRGEDFAERLVSHRVNGLPGRFSRQEGEVKPESQFEQGGGPAWVLLAPTNPNTHHHKRNGTYLHAFSRSQGVFRLLFFAKGTRFDSLLA